MTEYSVVGKRLSRVDAVEKVTGKALYSADIDLPNMLHGKVLRSPYARARIRRLDITRAQALEGVMAVIKLREGFTATEEEIIEHCKGYLASYKKPRRVAFVDSLPIGGGMKIQKFKLREQYATLE